MASPDQYTGATSINSSGIKGFLNLPYLRTLMFIFKVLLIITQALGVVAASIQYGHWVSSRFYDFVAVIGIIVAILAIILNLINVFDRFEQVPWNFIGLGFAAIWALLMFVASCIMAALSGYYASMATYVVAAVFGFATVALYLAEGGYRVYLWRMINQRAARRAATAAANPR